MHLLNAGGLLDCRWNASWYEVLHGKGGLGLMTGNLLGWGGVWLYQVEMKHQHTPHGRCVGLEGLACKGLFFLVVM